MLLDEPAQQLTDVAPTGCRPFEDSVDEVVDELLHDGRVEVGANCLDGILEINVES